MAAIFKSSLQNLSPLPTSLRVEPLAKPKTGLKFFVNTTKPKTKVLAVFGQKLETKVSTLSQRPFMNTGPGSCKTTVQFWQKVHGVDITHNNVCSSMLSCFYSYVAATINRASYF